MKRKIAVLLAGLAFSSAAASAAPMVLTYYSDYQGNYAALTKYYSNFNAVSVDFYNITKEGAITGNGAATPTNALSFLRDRKIAAYGCISNVDSDWSADIAHAVSTTALNQSVANLVKFAQANGFAGINIDFEAVAQGDRNNFSNFIQVLGRALHAKGLKLIVSVPAFSTKDENHEANYGYDLRALGAAADYLQIMTYDEAIPTWPPGPVAGSDWMENDLDYAVSLVPASKILNGIPAYGYDWKSDNSGKQLFWSKTQALIAQYGAKPRYDAGTHSVKFTYAAKDGSGLHTVWTENARSVALKASLVNAYGLGGTSLYALGMEDAGFWAAVKQGLAQQ
ncbi:glycosyl hydrolase family 18 protein [Chromobacterium piscinae]|uniref:glycosyl hydrolase family 18 protein n=1 Tax=Chromobacterium piscinae TaxID=686831 RepID=UPI001E551639|nr:glycosyl hydrolase family 18 protein [Chromobacterium piscinae]MCD4503875.1 glycosyl hydrolase family 18 protein [Chromobacterium piscinae]